MLRLDFGDGGAGVDGTLSSGPASIWRAKSASRIMDEFSTLQIAAVFKPSRFALRRAAKVSAVSLD